MVREGKGRMLDEPTQGTNISGDAELAQQMYHEELRQLEGGELAPSEEWVFDRSDATATTPQPAQQVVAESSAQAARRGEAQTADLTQCVRCLEHFRGREVARAPCGHALCSTCLCDLFRLSMRDEEAFPPRCCGPPVEPFNLAEVRYHLGEELAQSFFEKAIEFSTNNRTYCHVPQCATFIPTVRNGDLAICPACHEHTWTMCKAAAHQGQDCPQDAGLQQLVETARSRGWQRCACGRYLELREACNHMTCVCGHELCYACGTGYVDRRKACRCPLYGPQPGLARPRAVEPQDRQQQQLEYQALFGAVNREAEVWQPVQEPQAAVERLQPALRRPRPEDIRLPPRQVQAAARNAQHDQALDAQVQPRLALPRHQEELQVMQRQYEELQRHQEQLQQQLQAANALAETIEQQRRAGQARQQQTPAPPAVQNLLPARLPYSSRRLRAAPTPLQRAPQVQVPHGTYYLRPARLQETHRPRTAPVPPQPANPAAQVHPAVQNLRPIRIARAQWANILQGETQIQNHQPPHQVQPQAPQLRDNHQDRPQVLPRAAPHDHSNQQAPNQAVPAQAQANCAHAQRWRQFPGYHHCPVCNKDKKDQVGVCGLCDTVACYYCRKTGRLSFVARDSAECAHEERWQRFPGYHHCPVCNKDKKDQVGECRLCNTVACYHCRRNGRL